MYCKFIAKKYCPHVGDTFPYDDRFTWKGYYLGLDGKKFHGVSFSTGNRFISVDEKDSIFNTYLVKRENNARVKKKVPANMWQSNSAATNWGITYYTTLNI